MNGRVSRVRKEHPLDAITKGAVFTYVELDHSFGEATVKQDDRTGRFLIHKFTPGAGHVLRISGRACRPTSLSRQSVST